MGVMINAGLVCFVGKKMNKMNEKMNPINIFLLFFCLSHNLQKALVVLEV